MNAKCQRACACSLLALTWSFALVAGAAHAQETRHHQDAAGVLDSERQLEAPAITLGPTQGLVIGSAESRTRIEFHLAAWFRWNLAQSNQNTDSQWTVPLVRPAVDAFFFAEKIRVFVQPELAGATPKLLDFFVNAQFSPGIKLRLGQFRTPFSRSFISPIIQLLFPDRGMVVDAFRLGRDTGVMLHGQVARSAFEYYLGIFNGATVNNLANIDPVPMPIVRLVYNVGGPVPYDQVPSAQRRPVAPGLALGVNGAYRRKRLPVDLSSSDTEQEESWNSSADIAVVAGPVAATAEGFLRYGRVSAGPWQRAWGAYVQGGIFVLPQVFELAARLGWMDTDAVGLQQTYELGLNSYFTIDGQALGHHLKCSLRYAFLTVERAMLPIASRESHEVTLQGQLWF